jgi:hypothetical protein
MPAANTMREKPGRDRQNVQDKNNRMDNSTHVVTRCNRRSITATQVEGLHADYAILRPFQHFNSNVAFTGQPHVIVPKNKFRQTIATQRLDQDVHRLGCIHFGSNTAPPLRT